MGTGAAQGDFRDLVIFALPGVQSFIEETRSTCDVSAASQICAALAAKVVPGGNVPETPGFPRAAWLPDTPAPPAASMPGELRVGHVRCLVTESIQRRVAHASLAAGPALSTVTVRFTSPVSFSQNSIDVLVPDPRLIAGSWRRRWNSSLPEGDHLAITDDAWQATHRPLGLAAFDLRTETRDSGHGRDRSGFTGTAMLRLARTTPPTARQVLSTLARFAEYCGTGAQTTHGFGATTLIPDPEPPGG